MFLQIMSEMRCHAIEFPDWCWNPHMIQHVKQFWLSCVCVTNTRNVELQLIQFTCSILECGSWFSFRSWSTSEIKFYFNIWKTAEQTKKKILEIVYRTEAVSHMWVFVFLKRGHDNCEGDPRSGQPSTAHNLEVVTVVCELLARDHYMAGEVMEDWVHINRKTVPSSFKKFF